MARAARGSSGPQQVYDQITASEPWQTMQQIERAVISAPASGGNGAVELPPEAAGWDAAYGQVAQQMGQLNLVQTEAILVTADRVADDIRNGRCGRPAAASPRSC